MYDFANSSYTTVVITAIFSAYFVAVVAGAQAWATLAWTAALAVSNLLLMAIGPVLGAYADLRGNKKRLLLASTVGCVATTAALALAGPETFWQTMGLLVLSSIFFGIGESLAAAFHAQQAMGFTMQDTVLLIIVVNITAAVGAFAFGYIQDCIGHVATIAATLAGWIVMIALAWLARGPLLFWIAANIAGFCLGASQSAARAFIGVLSPASRRAEFFGLWGMAVRLASIVGPLTYGLVSWLSQGDHRLAMLITGSYFVAGLLLLKAVDAERGKCAAQS